MIKDMEKSKIYVLILLYFAFIGLGLPDQILGIAWPSIRTDFSKPLDAAGMVVFIVTVITAFSGYINGYIAEKFSISQILTVSVLLTAVGVLGYALSPDWLVFLLFAIPTGLGAGSVDSALNNYVAMNYSSKHMSWLHAFWGIGSTIGPLIITAAFTLGFNWRFGYGTVAFLLFLLTLIFFLERKCFVQSACSDKSSSTKTNMITLNTFLSSSFFFFYTSVEGGIGLWIYSVMTEARGFAALSAGILVSLYWASLTIGRIVVGFITQKISDKKIILSSLLISLIAMLFICCTYKFTTCFGLMLLGLGLSGIYPCTMNETHKRYDVNTAKILMGHQVGAASLGFALVVPAIGFVIQRIGLNYLPVLTLCMLIYLIAVEMRLRKLNKDY